MCLAAFLSSLFATGRVRVPLPEGCAGAGDAAVDDLLVQHEMEYRQGVPGIPPSLDVPSARWAAHAFYQACQFLVFRNTPAEIITRELAQDCPAAKPASLHYSVDLVFRYLPDLYAHAHSASEDDVLVAQLRLWANRCPLSSVGIPGIEPKNIDVLAGHPTLRTMYVDRIIAKKDFARLADSRVREWIKSAVGAFPQLAPEIAKAIEALENDNVEEKIA